MKLIREDVSDTRLKTTSTLFTIVAFFLVLLLLIFLKYDVDKYLTFIVVVGWVIANVLSFILSIELRKRKKSSFSEKE